MPAISGRMSREIHVAALKAALLLLVGKAPGSVPVPYRVEENHGYRISLRDHRRESRQGAFLSRAKSVLPEDAVHLSQVRNPYAVVPRARDGRRAMRHIVDRRAHRGRSSFRLSAR